MRLKTKGFTHQKSARFSGGFTLIEVILVLAISSLLALILFNSYGDINRRTQFHDGIERIVTQLETTRNEANSTINANANSGDDASKVNFSRVVNFFANPVSGVSQMRVFKLSADNTEGQPTNVQLNVDATGAEGGPEVTDLKWGIKYLPPPPPSGSTHNYIVFARNLGDGKINTFSYTLSNSSQLKDPAVVTFTVGSSNDTDVAALKFSSADNKLHATVRVNSATGEITKTYDD